MNPAFQIGQLVGGNFAKERQKTSDTNFLDKILSESLATQDPRVLQNNLTQILKNVSPERQPQAIKFLENRLESLDKQKQRQARINAGFDPDLEPTLASTKYKEDLKQKELNRFRQGDTPVSAEQIVPRGTMQEQPFVPGMQIPEQQQYEPLPTELQNQVPSRAWFSNLTKDQLIEASGSPYKEISEPSKQALEMMKADKQDLKDFDKRSQKYDDDLRNKYKIAKSQLVAIKDIEKAVKSGNVKPNSWANVFKNFGLVGDKISEALLNSDQAALLASIPQLLEGWREVFGVRLTDADLRLLQDKLPSLGKSQEANEAVLKIMRKYGEMTLLRGEIASQIKKENGYLRPLGYEEMVEEKFDQMTRPIRVKHPKTNTEFEIPAYKLGAAIKNYGVYVINE